MSIQLGMEIALFAAFYKAIALALNDPNVAFGKTPRGVRWLKNCLCRSKVTDDTQTTSMDGRIVIRFHFSFPFSKPLFHR